MQLVAPFVIYLLVNTRYAVLRDCSPVALIACVHGSRSKSTDSPTPHLVALFPHVLRSHSAVVSKKITEPAFAHLNRRFHPFTALAFPYYRYNLHYLASCSRKIHVTSCIRQLSYLQFVEDSLSPNSEVRNKGVVFTVFFLDSETLLCFIVVVDGLQRLQDGTSFIVYQRSSLTKVCTSVQLHQSIANQSFDESNHALCGVIL